MAGSLLVHQNRDSPSPRSFLRRFNELPNARISNSDSYPVRRNSSRPMRAADALDPQLVRKTVLNQKGACHSG